MSQNPKLGLALSVAGIVMTVLGFVGYVGLLAIGKGLSLALGAFGVVAIICSYVYTFHYADVLARHR
ncbi:MAG: hypothetical protein GX224_00045 [Thermoplasmatales archaeon]|nr:hypothetical protein [Thermoplasmatales archaeon]